jgi:hypothetical protein
MKKETEESLQFETNIINLFERAISLGYKPYFNLPHKTTRGNEIEALLIIEWLSQKGYEVELNTLIHNGICKVDVWKWSAKNGTTGHNLKNLGLSDMRFNTKLEARCLAIEICLNYIEKEKSNEERKE